MLHFFPSSPLSFCKLTNTFLCLAPPSCPLLFPDYITLASFLSFSLFNPSLKSPLKMHTHIHNYTSCFSCNPSLFCLTLQIFTLLQPSHLFVFLSPVYYKNSPTLESQMFHWLSWFSGCVRARMCVDRVGSYCFWWYLKYFFMTRGSFCPLILLSVFSDLFIFWSASCLLLPSAVPSLNLSLNCSAFMSDILYFTFVAVTGLAQQTHRAYLDIRTAAMVKILTEYPLNYFICIQIHQTSYISTSVHVNLLGCAQSLPCFGSVQWTKGAVKLGLLVCTEMLKR